MNKWRTLVEGRLVERAGRGAPGEHYEQRKVVEKLEAAGIAFFAVPNGGRRDIKEAAKLKREGVRRGVPDLVILRAPPAFPKWTGVALEMKRASGTFTDVSEDQRVWLSRFQMARRIPVVGYGWRDAVEKLKALGYVLALVMALAGPVEARAPEWTPRSVPAPLTVAVELHVAALVADVDPLWLAAVTYTESRWIGRKAGDGGASVGIWQMTASAAQAVAPWWSRETARKALSLPVVRSVVAGLYWRRLIRRYGRRSAPAVYTCGPKCKGMSSTRTARAYERHYRRMRRSK